MTTTAEPPVGVDAETANERTQPQDISAEQCVLGGMMLSKDAIADATSILKPTDLYRHPHRLIYEAICDLYNRDEPADPGIVGAYLADAGNLVRVGGAPYLHDCVSAIPTAANTAYYARIVANRAKRRRLIEAGTKVVQIGYSQDGQDEDELIDQAQQVVYDITDRAARDEVRTIGSVLKRALDNIEAAGAGDSHNGLPTGFIDLDRLLLGLHPGQLIVVAGRPGMGKSVLACGIARHAAVEHGLASVVFSLEMSEDELVIRSLAAESAVPLNVLRSGKLTDNDWLKLTSRLGAVDTAPLLLDDSPNLTLMEIRAKVRRLKQRQDLKLIVVDYLQLVGSDRRVESRQQEVADLSRGLKLLAKEVDCPVIAVSQLNRNPEQRSDKRPTMADLRESGAIENDADVVILVHRDDYYDKECARAGEADLIIAKHRNGATDTVTVAAQLHLSRFKDLAIA